MTYDEAIGYIYNCAVFGAKKDGLNNITALLSRMGDPQRRYPVLHVAGTNGKGSISCYMDSILRRAGYRTGLYTSPYLERFNERIRMDGQPIPDADLASQAQRILDVYKAGAQDGLPHPTRFEMTCAMAFDYYARQGAEAAVIEVGMGGRLDSTNVVDPAVAVIANIGLDHTNVLGDTIEQIAYEKAGIIKPNRPVVLYPQDDPARSVIAGIARERGAELLDLADAQIGMLDQQLNRQVFSLRYRDLDMPELIIRMNGPHQVYNAATAAVAAYCASGTLPRITPDAIRQGLADAFWAGRLEVAGQNPLIILDGAHNPQCVQALVRSVRPYVHNKATTLLCGIGSGKDARQMLEPLASLADRIIITIPDATYHVRPLGEIRDILHELGREPRLIENPREAVQAAMDELGPDDALIICGSLYLVGAVRGDVLKRAPGAAGRLTAGLMR